MVCACPARYFHRNSPSVFTAGAFLLGNPPCRSDPRNKEVIKNGKTTQIHRNLRNPFSRDYWRDAAAELKSTKSLVIAAMMIALRVATKGIAVPIAPNLKLFNAASFINALGAMIIGPVACIPAAILSDFLGVLLWEGLGTYFLPYVLTEIASSFIWALLLYRAKPSTWRVMIGRFAICIFVNVLLGVWIDMLYQAYFYGNSTLALTVPRVLKNTFMFPIESVAMTFFLGMMVPITNRMGLTYSSSDAKASMIFTKKQIVALVLLFVVGVGAVLAYLPVYYSEYSYSSKYSVSERIEKNQSMQPIVLENTDDWDDVTTMTCVESAYGKFMSKEITYTVAIYTVADGTEMNDEIWKLSKSKAAKHEALTRVGTATVVVNDKTGETVSFELLPNS